jgi:hypothetical protein
VKHRFTNIAIPMDSYPPTINREPFYVTTRYG